MLLREESARVKLDAEGPVAWCIGNADARGFYRTNYDDATLARLLPAVGELRPAERIVLISDQWALVRANQAPIERFLDLVASLRGRGGPRRPRRGRRPAGADRAPLLGG